MCQCSALAHFFHVQSPCQKTIEESLKVQESHKLTDKSISYCRDAGPQRALQDGNLHAATDAEPFHHAFPIYMTILNYHHVYCIYVCVGRHIYIYVNMFIFICVFIYSLTYLSIFNLFIYLFMYISYYISIDYARVILANSRQAKLNLMIFSGDDDSICATLGSQQFVWDLGSSTRLALLLVVGSN